MTVKATACDLEYFHTPFKSFCLVGVEIVILKDGSVRIKVFSQNNLILICSEISF